MSMSNLRTDIIIFLAFLTPQVGRCTRFYCVFAFVSIGVLGIKVKVMLPHDPTGKSGPKRPLPDQVTPRTMHAPPLSDPMIPLSGHRGRAEGRGEGGRPLFRTERDKAAI